MSTDIEFQCPTQNNASGVLPGFSLSFQDLAPTKNVNTVVNVNLIPVIANTASTTDYNTAEMYNETTGIITVPETGKWNLYINYATSNGNSTYINSIIANWIITGYTGVSFICGDDNLVVSQNVTGVYSIPVYLTKGTLMQLNSTYTLTGPAGASGRFIIRLGMQYIGI